MSEILSDLPSLSFGGMEAFALLVIFWLMVGSSLQSNHIKYSDPSAP